MGHSWSGSCRLIAEPAFCLLCDASLLGLWLKENENACRGSSCCLPVCHKEGRDVIIKFVYNLKHKPTSY